MQFFLANFHAERLSGSVDTPETGTSPTGDIAPVDAPVADEAHESSTVPVLSGIR